MQGNNSTDWCTRFCTECTLYMEINYHAFSWDQSTAKIDNILLLNLFQFLISVWGDHACRQRLHILKNVPYLILLFINLMWTIPLQLTDSGITKSILIANLQHAATDFPCCTYITALRTPMYVNKGYALCFAQQRGWGNRPVARSSCVSELLMPFPISNLV